MALCTKVTRPCVQHFNWVNNAEQRLATLWDSLCFKGCLLLAFVWKVQENQLHQVRRQSNESPKISVTWVLTTELLDHFSHLHYVDHTYSCKDKQFRCEFCRVIMGEVLAYLHQKDCKGHDFSHLSGIFLFVWEHILHHLWPNVKGDQLICNGSDECVVWMEYSIHRRNIHAIPLNSILSY